MYERFRTSKYTNLCPCVYVLVHGPFSLVVVVVVVVVGGGGGGGAYVLGTHPDVDMLIQGDDTHRWWNKGAGGALAPPPPNCA